MWHQSQHALFLPVSATHSPHFAFTHLGGLLYQKETDTEIK